MSRLKLFLNGCAVALVLGLSLSAFAQQQGEELLSQLISGSQFERGDKKTKYELFKYEDFRVDGCQLEWTDTNQSFENGEQTSLVVKRVLVSAGGIDPKSLRSDDYYKGRSVSFTMRENSSVMAKEKIVRADSGEEKSSSFATGCGFYFAKPELAKKVFNELGRKISTCKK